MKKRLKHFASNGDTVRLVLERKEGSCSSGVLLKFEIEDDGLWYEKATLDSYFLPELKKAVNQVTAVIDQFKRDWP